MHRRSTGTRVRAALKETRAVYERADESYRRFSCPRSGDCCHFAHTGREPWLWRAEWLLLLDYLNKHGMGLPAPRADGGCPFLDSAGARCSVYAARPFGCRTFFCGRRAGPAREPLEAVVELSKRLERVSLDCAPEWEEPRTLSDWWKGEWARGSMPEVD